MNRTKPQPGPAAPALAPERQRFRLQPADLCIPAEQPFEHDLLGRERPARILTRIVDSIDGPCVLSIDGAYGSGKTTFLRLWQQHLQNEGFPVVRLNAWETDHSGDPLLALTEGIDRDLKALNDRNTRPLIKKLTTAAQKFATHTAPVLAAGIVGTGVAATGAPPPAVAAVSTAAKRASEGAIKNLREQRDSAPEFRRSLANLAKNLVGSSGHPLVITIDELDRCRPPYAVEMLEAAKHLFSVDHVIFALAVNRSQLSHAVKALYGQDFEADDYLKRFFDVDFRLPEPDKVTFVADHLNRAGFDALFGRNPVLWNAHEEREVFHKMLSVLLGGSPLTLREIRQAIQHLGLVFASVDAREQPFAIPTAMAIILKCVVPATYDQLRRRAISGGGAVNHVEELFAAIGAPKNGERSRSEHSKTYAEIEAVFAACAAEASPVATSLYHRHGSRALGMTEYWASPLIEKYQVRPFQPAGDDPDRLDYDYASVFRFVLNWFTNGASLNPPIPVGFLIASERIELLHASLLPKPDASDASG